jgi:hypothetical protein
MSKNINRDSVLFVGSLLTEYLSETENSETEERLFEAAHNFFFQTEMYSVPSWVR